jgi:hypothetical protein
MEAYDGNPDLQNAVEQATKDASDADLAAFARATTRDRAENLLRNIRDSAPSPAMRARADAVLRELGKIPYEGPKIRDGQAPERTDG